MSEACKLIDLSDWTPDEDNPIFPIGAQPKRLLVCPTPAPTPGLIAGHNYLFKVPPSWKRHQVWSEVIASILGARLGVSVPRCFVARDAGGNVGALIEFFYRYADQVAGPDRFVHASDLLQRTILDKKSGRPHSLKLNVRLCRALKIADAATWWAKAIAFDALIGNTDRHPQNWGVLVAGPGLQLRYSMAPAFDNGTSLGYELQDDRIERPWDRARLENYIRRGTHHCSWEYGSMKGVGHAELCRAFAQVDSEAGQTMQAVLNFEAEMVPHWCSWLKHVEIENPLSDARLQFVASLIDARRSRLTAVLGG